MMFGLHLISRKQREREMTKVGGVAGGGGGSGNMEGRGGGSRFNP